MKKIVYILKKKKIKRLLVSSVFSVSNIFYYKEGLSPLT